MFATLLSIARCSVQMENIVRRVKKEDISKMSALPSSEGKPYQSLSNVSTIGYTSAQAKREKKVNPKFIGSSWTPEGRSKRKRTRTSQIFGQVAEGHYAPVLALNPLAVNSETDTGVFDAWYYKHVLAYKA